MNNFKIATLTAFVMGVGSVSAQDTNAALKAIDGEQYEKAKSILKSVINTDPGDGRASFLLGKVYLYQDFQDSAKVVFDKGITAKKDGNLNAIGLGQIELNKGNLSGAQSQFDAAMKDMRKKDTEEFVFVARAYMDAEKPDFKNALTVLEKAKAVNSQDAQVQLALGDAHFGNKNQNEAYSAYRNAFNADNNLIRAKVQSGVLLKFARAFGEAVKSFDAVVATNPTYGPVYRELAETYYLWGNNEPRNYDAYIKKALSYYEKYMSLTDYSLTSRMRHADFLILARDYKALEAEAEAMKKLDKVNPRILRYLGYSAYENGNTDVAISSLQDFIQNPSSKIIARDHMYLGLAKLKKASGDNGTTVDQNAFSDAVAAIRKAVEMDNTLVVDLSELGKKFFEQKMFKEASMIYEVAVSNPESRNYLQDMFYYGYALYYANNKSDGKADIAQLEKAEKAFAVVAEQSPATQDAYLFRARANSLMEKNLEMTKSYEDYIRVTLEKGAEETSKEATKKKLVEAYNNAGAFYAATNDKVKAKEYFNKTLSIAPSDSFATQSLKSL